MKFRASMLGDLMTASRSKSDVLSETAKSKIKQKAKEDFYGYRYEIASKYIDKGITHEQDTIELINKVRLTDYIKHQGRVENEYLTGECDILLPDMVIDCKTSWSLHTFPATPDDGYDKGYEWQLRAYMLLYDRPQAELIYGLVSTDPELCKYEPAELHMVDHIEPSKRITVLSFERDAEKEEQIMERLAICQQYYIDYLTKLQEK